MQVIGAGMSRTGTMSTHAALERLGFRCYHMTEVARAGGHLEAWHRYLSGAGPMDWPILFQNYEATVDTPSCLFYREIMAAFPDARVVLTLRDPDKWYDSLVTLASALEEFRPMVLESRRLGQFLTITDEVGQRLTSGDFSREHCIKFRMAGDRYARFLKDPYHWNRFPISMKAERQSTRLCVRPFCDRKVDQRVEFGWVRIFDDEKFLEADARYPVAMRQQLGVDGCNEPRFQQRTFEGFSERR